MAVPKSGPGPYEPQRNPMIWGYQWSNDARRRKLSVLWKRGWNEIPVVMFGTGLGLIGIGLICRGVYLWYRDEGWRKRFRRRYTVYRENDPRVPNIREWTDAPPGMDKYD